MSTIIGTLSPIGPANPIFADVISSTDEASANDNSWTFKVLLSLASLTSFKPLTNTAQNLSSALYINVLTNFSLSSCKYSDTSSIVPALGVLTSSLILISSSDFLVKSVQLATSLFAAYPQWSHITNLSS